MRHFEHALIAHRYDLGRPRFHDALLASFVHAIGFDGRWAKALDVACGTGHSSQPLLRYADTVIGIDISEAMIKIARTRVPGVTFIVGSAEALPADMGPVDAVFIASGFHWLAKDAFLSSVEAVLAVGGWLVSYDLGPPRVMRDNPAFGRWYTGEYWARYPNPPRARGTFTEFIASSRGLLANSGEITSETTIDLSPAELCAMITTQSNIHQALAGGMPIEEIDSYLKAAVAGFFAGAKASFVFTSRIQYARRVRSRH